MRPPPIAALALSLLLPRPAHAGRADDNVPYQHVVMLDWQGYRLRPLTIEKSVSIRTPSGLRQPTYPSLGVPMTPQDVEEHFQAVKDSMTDFARTHKESPPTLLIFIHGGLNSPQLTVQRSTALTETIKASGQYPLFINWDSRLKSSYVEHAAYMWQGHHVAAKWPFTPLEVGYDVARAALHLPLTSGNLLLNTVKSIRDNPIDQDDKVSVARAHLEKEGRLHPGRDLGGAFELPTGPLVAPLSITSLITAPLLESLGRPSWELMRRRTKLLFDTDKSHYATAVTTADAAAIQGGLQDFMGRLQDFLSEHKEWRINIVGHSMGTIVMNQVLRRFPTLPYDHIVYMAAACSVRDYRDTMALLLPQNPQVHVHHLVLNDSAEWRDSVYSLPFLPRGSLLTWVDDYFETQDTPLDRTAGRYVNLMRSFDELGPLVSRNLTVQVFNSGPKCATPRHHGDFTEPEHLKFWLPENWDPRADGCPSTPP